MLEVIFCLGLVLLIALLVLPMFGQATSDAHRSNCANNIHQSGLAIGLYLEDYDNYFPTYRVDTQSRQHGEDLLYWHDRFCRASQTYPGQITWVTLTQAFASKRGNHSGRRLRYATLEDDIYHCPADGARYDAATSYEYKMQLATTLPLFEVRSPGGTVMLWEQWGFHMQERYSEYDRRAELNVVFVDQHAAYLPLSKTVNSKYGGGPDLHWLPSGANVPAALTSQDVSN